MLQTCPAHTSFNKLYFKCCLCLIQLLTVVFYLEFKCLSVVFFFFCFLHKQLILLNTAKRRTMPALSAPTDFGSSPPSPVDSSPRRLSWGKLVQRLTDFSTSANSSSIESGSNSGSRSDLSDSGIQRCKHLPHLK